MGLKRGFDRIGIDRGRDDGDVWIGRGHLIGEVWRGDNHALSIAQNHPNLPGILFENGIVEVKDKVTGTLRETPFQERP